MSRSMVVFGGVGTLAALTGLFAMAVGAPRFVAAVAGVLAISCGLVAVARQL
jgi:hypothetical protein